MSHDSSSYKRLFEFSGVYNLFQKAIGRDKAFSLFVQRFVACKPGERLLDIGCGTGTILKFLPEGVDYTGFDMNGDYIRFAKKKYGDRAHFQQRSIGEEILPDVEKFDWVMAYGLLHHLDNSLSERLFVDAVEYLKPGGKFVTMDPVRAKGNKKITNWLIARDRGQNIRTPESYEKLARQYFGGVEAEVVRDALRIPYAHFVMCCGLG